MCPSTAGAASVSSSSMHVSQRLCAETEGRVKRGRFAVARMPLILSKTAGDSRPMRAADGWPMMSHCASLYLLLGHHLLLQSVHGSAFGQLPGKQPSSPQWKHFFSPFGCSGLVTHA